MTDRTSRTRQTLGLGQALLAPSPLPTRIAGAVLCGLTLLLATLETASAGEVGLGRMYRRTATGPRAQVETAAEPVADDDFSMPTPAEGPTPGKAATPGKATTPSANVAETDRGQRNGSQPAELGAVETTAAANGPLTRTDAPALERVVRPQPTLIRTAGVGIETAPQTASARVTPATNARVTPTVRAVQRGRACVVNIHSEKRSKSRDAMFNATGDRKVNGMGTGIVVDERGYIVTNYHVVQDVDSLRVTLYDGSAFTARVVSIERRTDLAIIHIPTTRPLPVMPLGTSSDLLLGEDVLAIGNAFGYEHSVTRGIISAIGRDVDVNETQAYRNLIQIDAAINPGNSGGPLLNRDGEVIGINVAIRAGAQRIGFAIPIDDARVTIAKLLSVESLSGIWHGAVTRDRKRADEQTLTVDRVESGSPAAKAGLQAGDVITKVGKIRTADGADFERALLGRTAGSQVPVEFLRGGVEQTVSLGLVTRTGRPARSHVPQQTAELAAPPRDVVWEKIGVRVRPIDPVRLASLGSSYRGGMVVTDVRGGSLAEDNSI